MNPNNIGFKLIKICFKKYLTFILLFVILRMSNKKRKEGVYYAYVQSKKKGITKCSHSWNQIEDACEKAGKTPTLWTRVWKGSHDSSESAS